MFQTLAECGVIHGEEMCSLSAEFPDASATSLLLHYTYNTEAEQNTFTIALVDADAVKPHSSIEPGPVYAHNYTISTGSTDVFVHAYNTTWKCLNNLDACGS